MPHVLGAVVAVPLPNTRMIHPRWQDRHAPVVLGGMEAQVRLSRPAGLGTRDPETGATAEIPAAVYYEGPARLQRRTPLAPAGSDTARNVTTGDYLLAVPVDVGAEPQRGDIADMIASPDPLQVGVRLYVTDVPTATQILQRNLGVDLRKPDTTGRG